MYRHHSLKHAGCYYDTPISEIRNKALIEGFREIGRGREIKTGPSTAGAITVESELRNDEKRAGGVDKIAVHFACGVREDTETDDAVGEEVRVCDGIAAADAEKDEDTWSDSSGDFVIDEHAGGGNPLDYSFHALGRADRPPPLAARKEGGGFVVATLGNLPDSSKIRLDRYSV